MRQEITHVILSDEFLKSYIYLSARLLQRKLQTIFDKMLNLASGQGNQDTSPTSQYFYRLG